MFTTITSGHRRLKSFSPLKCLIVFTAARGHCTGRQTYRTCFSHIWFAFCSSVCSKIFHPSLHSCTPLPLPPVPVSSLRLHPRPGWQPANGRLHLPGAAADPSSGHDWGGRSLLSSPRNAEVPDAPHHYDAASAAAALSTLTRAFTPPHPSPELQLLFFFSSLVLPPESSLSSVTLWNNTVTEFRFSFRS